MLIYLSSPSAGREVDGRGVQMARLRPVRPSCLPDGARARDRLANTTTFRLTRAEKSSSNPTLTTKYLLTTSSFLFLNRKTSEDNSSSTIAKAIIFGKTCISLLTRTSFPTLLLSKIVLRSSFFLKKKGLLEDRFDRKM